MIWLLPLTAVAATLSGRLVSVDDGTPVVGATVEAWDPRLRGFSATTAADGAFSLPLETAGPWRIRAVPRYDDPHLWRMADGGTDFCASMPVDVSADLDYGEIALSQGVRVTGRITSDSGTALVGATVWAQPESGLVNFERPALTDAEGRFEVVGLDTASAGDAWTLEASIDDWPEQYLGGAYDLELADLLGLTEPTTEAGDWALLPGITVGGTVSGPDGAVSEGTVHAYASSQIVTVSTETDGTYLAVGLPPGDVVTWANSPGLAQTYLPDADRPTSVVSVPDEGSVRTDLDLFLPDEAIFEFQFVDAETGDAVPGIGGLLYNDTRTVGLGDAADEDGTLRIDRLHGGDWTLYAWGADEGFTDDWIRDSDGEESVFTIAEGGRETVVVPLERAARIQGRVIDDNGDPVDGIAIAAVRDDQSGLATTTDPDGAFVLGGMGAGTWTLSAVYDAICPGDPGYVPFYWPGTPNPDWSRPLELEVGEQRTGLVIKVPSDADLDEMADDWERTHGLDPTDATDASDDPDRDSYSNLDEYRMGTDPHEGTPEVEACGCTAGPSPARFAWLAVLGLVWRRRSTAP